MSTRADDPAEASRTWIQRRNNRRGIGLTTTTPTAAVAVQSNIARSRRKTKTKPLPVTGYDSDAIEDLYDRRPLQVGWRLNSLGFPLLGMSFCFCRALQ